jgi:hypothetical protein
MRIRTITIVVALLILAMALTVYAGTAGNLDPTNPPESTSAYSLADIYNRLDNGAAGTQSAFTEPAAGPVAGTMYTLNDIMASAPAVDNTKGATQTHLLAGRTAWGLTSGEWGPITGTMPLSSLPRTGQTTPRYTRDDGQLQMGAALPVPRFVTGTTGVVTDSLTGLIWLENAHCPKTTRDFETAILADISSLNSSGKMNTFDCGDTSNGGSHQTDWRLPNVRELHSLVHYGFRDPAVSNTAGTAAWLKSGDPFINLQGFTYWSSTSRTAHETLAWSVDMIEGEATVSAKSSKHNVWPVRGGQ